MAVKQFMVEEYQVRLGNALNATFSEMGPFVDLLRNEEPIYAYLNSNTPACNSIRTAEEPVGEEKG